MCDSKEIVSAFVFGLGFLHLCPVHPQPRPFKLKLFLDFRAIFLSEWPLIFLIITIHQVIWPSPVTFDGGYLDLARLLGECVLTRNEGPDPKKNLPKSRNSCCMNSGGVGEDS